MSLSFACGRARETRDFLRWTQGREIAMLTCSALLTVEAMVCCVTRSGRVSLSEERRSSMRDERLNGGDDDSNETSAQSAQPDRAQHRRDGRVLSPAGARHSG